MKKTDEKTPIINGEVEPKEETPKESETEPEVENEAFWIKAGKAIWNGTKWLFKKTWKFATGAGAAVATMAIIDHIGHDDPADTEHPEETDPE